MLVGSSLHAAGKSLHSLGVVCFLTGRHGLSAPQCLRSGAAAIRISILQSPAGRGAGSLLREQERRADLRDRLRQAQLQLARKPICALPVKEALSAPEPTPSPQLEPRQQTEEVMKFPEKIEDLKGCWQSERGDIDVVADTPERKPWGKVRICFCFGTNGRGSIRYRFFEGDRCLGPLSAKLTAGNCSCSIRSSGAGHMDILWRRI